MSQPDLHADSRHASQLLGVGLAFVFVYAATSGLVHPGAYRSYLPSSLADLRPSTTDALLRGFALGEAVLAIAVLGHRYRYEASLLCAGTLSMIVAFNANAFNVLFRNVAIIFAALALAHLSRGDRTRLHAVTVAASAVKDDVVSIGADVPEESHELRKAS